MFDYLFSQVLLANRRRKVVVCNWTDPIETLSFEKDIADIMRKKGIDVAPDNTIPAINNYWVINKFGSRSNFHYDVRLNTFERESSVSSYEEVINRVRSFYKV